MSRIQPSVVYIAPDRMGGMLNAIANLLAYAPRDGLDSHVVLTRNRSGEGLRFTDRLNCVSLAEVEYALPAENLHAVMRRLARAIPEGPGVVVAGDLLDLATLSVHDVGRAVVLILHGDHDYYYDLAMKHDAVVHAFITISRHMHQRLVSCLPHRAESIFCIHHGVPLAARVRRPQAGALRLVFAGRLDEDKGVLDLPLIEQALRRRGVVARWTIVGDGPEAARLREGWGSADVTFTGALSNATTIALLADHDIFVLPTRAEGFPIALLEAMSAALVPVVSHIPSGVPDIVDDQVTGFLPPVGDVDAFADAIACVDADRGRLERMSAACRERIETRFDIRDRAAEYYRVFERCEALYRPLSKAARLQYGSRLDRKWMPNAAVYAVRSGRRWLRESRRDRSS